MGGGGSGQSLLVGSNPSSTGGIEIVLNVLAIDDDPDTLEYIRDFLTGEGHQLETLSDPATAVSALKTDAYHVVILDLIMPKLTGMDLLQQIRDADRDVAVVILTGHPSLETAAASIELDVSAYLKKPVKLGDFRQVLHRIARKKGLVLQREEELHLTLGRTIRQLRQQRSLTLKQMARRTNLSVSLLSQIERAESSASISSLFKIATAMQVRLVDLFDPF
jgi:DNA-binding NtrC family response regulator